MLAGLYDQILLPLHDENRAAGLGSSFQGGYQVAGLPRDRRRAPPLVGCQRRSKTEQKRPEVLSFSRRRQSAIDASTGHARRKP